MKAQRRILNIKWYDFVTNDSVWSQTKLTDLPLIIADRRHSLLGHVCHLPPDVPAHNILQHCVNLSQGRCLAPDWKRPSGRPRKTWIQQVAEDHGCTIDSLWSSAQDRSLWRSLQPSLVKHSSEWVLSLCECAEMAERMSALDIPIFFTNLYIKNNVINCTTPSVQSNVRCQHSSWIATVLYTHLSVLSLRCRITQQTKLAILFKY